MSAETNAGDSWKIFVERLKSYRDRLLQVDWRNRSILLKKTHKKWSLDLAMLSGYSPGLAEDLVLQAIRGKGRTCVVRNGDASEEALDIRSSLTQLERSTRTIFEESGLRDIYLGFPFLVGHLDRDHFVRAPIVLFPIRLQHLRDARPSGWYVLLPEDESPIFNRALLGALRKVAGISVPEGLQEQLEGILERASSDTVDPLAAYLRSLEDLLADAVIPRLRRGAFARQVVPLQPLAAKDIEELPFSDLQLETFAVIGSFPQASTAIYQDYETLIERANNGEHDQGVIDDLLEAPAPKSHREIPEDALDIDRIPDSELNFALPTDGSQEAVIIEAQHRECTLVRGPPGTGKSQVIVNLITNALAKGERVLVVCQKRAALDVVHQRLGRVGLSDSVVLMHDARADRPAVYAQLARRMEGEFSAPISRVSRELQETSRRIDETIRQINEIVKPLRQEYFGGIPLY